MERFVVLVTLCVVTVSATVIDDEVDFYNGFNISDFISPELDLPLDLNYTKLSLALRSEHPLAHLTTVEIIELYQYKVETYTVITDDNYILELHRMPGNHRNKSDNKPVVFLQHGLLCSSVDWVLAGPGRGLGFLLVDAGYDVWMGNARGSRYSRRHTNWTTEEPAYWNFDWHEIGTRDLPTMIDYALKITKHEKLFYIGHSQGSTSFFVMTSVIPKYNDKIIAMFSLAPVAFCSRMISPIFRAISAVLKPVQLLVNLIGAHEFKPSDEFFKKFMNLLCGKNSLAQPICINVMFLFTGFNQDQLDYDLLPAVLSHIPAGAAVNQFIHYGQMIRSGQFREFDYGIRQNIKKYRKFSPPEYDLNNVKVPVALHYSVNDWLSHPIDVDKLYARIKNPIGKFRVPHDKFNHMDYLFGKDVKTLLYDKIMSLMLRFEE